MQTFQHKTIVFGCDPEFFFSKDGKIVGAEKIIPQDGLIYDPSKKFEIKKGEEFKKKPDRLHTLRGNVLVSKVIIDGVQAELNPRPNTCRANLGNEISCCMRTVYETIKKDKTLSCNFSPTVDVSPKELESLSKKAQQFGCAPSKNTSGTNKISIKDASKYYYRSAGGHLHLGHDNNVDIKKALENCDVLVPLFDIIVGNTCVLIDRNEGNIERRKVYGKAGEYRTPPHGIEYRTLSNFWLQSYQLMGLVTGLARQAVNVLASSTKENNLAEMIIKSVSAEDIMNAINNNDIVLAQKNFDKMLPVLLEMTPNYNGEHYPLHKDHITYFKHFVNKGLDYWFKEDPLKHWMNLPEGHDTGFESFLMEGVKNDYEKYSIVKNSGK